MKRYIIAFYSDNHGVCQALIEAEDTEQALRSFFERHVTDYTANAEGFTYFREDFFDAKKPLGAVMEIN